MDIIRTKVNTATCPECGGEADYYRLTQEVTWPTGEVEDEDLGTLVYENLTLVGHEVICPHCGGVDYEPPVY